MVAVVEWRYEDSSASSKVAAGMAWACRVTLRQLLCTRQDGVHRKHGLHIEHVVMGCILGRYHGMAMHVAPLANLNSMRIDVPCSW